MYAIAFATEIDAWLSARRMRHIRAEVIDFPSDAPLRVVRFVLEQGQGETRVEVIRAEGVLSRVLASIGDRLKVGIAQSIVGERTLRVHGHGEVVIIKPFARRHWLRVCALEDAHAVVAESFAGVSA